MDPTKQTYRASPYVVFSWGGRERSVHSVEGNACGNIAVDMNVEDNRAVVLLSFESRVETFYIRKRLVCSGRLQFNLLQQSSSCKSNIRRVLCGELTLQFYCRSGVLMGVGRPIQYTEKLGVVTFYCGSSRSSTNLASTILKMPICDTAGALPLKQYSITGGDREGNLQVWSAASCVNGVVTRVRRIVATLRCI
ncbi:hypothetical protein J6590_030873 [Homalodisca vitripennis]|nr:hypothetical protein J6590_030873 [Homalodisca vitripennis]